jgi:hypothetical protein
LYIELDHRLSIIERCICKGQKWKQEKKWLKKKR